MDHVHQPGVDPGVLERIRALEGVITAEDKDQRARGLILRDAMVEQGDLLNQVPLEELAATAVYCGLSIGNARTRKSVAAALTPEMREELRSNENIYVSFDALTSLVKDEDPLVLMRKLFAEADGKDRITRDMVRKARGKVAGSIGTPEATIVQMITNRKFRERMLKELQETEDGRLLLLQFAEVFATLKKGHGPSSGKVKDDILSAIYKDRRSTVRLADALQGQTPLDESYQQGLTAHCDDQIRRYELLKAQAAGESVDDELAALLEAGDR